MRQMVEVLASFRWLSDNEVPEIYQKSYLTVFFNKPYSFLQSFGYMYKTS